MGNSFSSGKLEQIAVKKGYSKVDFNNALQREYGFYSNRRNSTEVIEFLENVSGIMPSQEILKKHNIYAITGTECEKEKISSSTIRIDFGESEVQEYYKSFFEKGNPHNVKALYEKTGILPDFKELNIQEIYKNCFQGGSGTYWVNWIWSLSGIKPKIGKRMIKNSLEKAVFNFNSIEVVQGILSFNEGAVPLSFNKSRLQEYYSKLLKQGDITPVLKLKDVLNIDFDKEKLFDYYSNLLERDNFGSLIKISRATKIFPRKKDLRKKVFSIMEDVTSSIHLIGTLNELLGPSQNDITLSEEDIQKYHRNALIEGMIYRSKEITDFFKVKPDEDSVQEAYKCFAKRKFFGEIIDLNEFSGVEPSEKVYEILLNEIIQEPEED